MRRILLVFHTACLLSLSGFQAASATPQARAVSLLYENDGNWENFSARSSALLFHEAVTASDAAEICQENNESLFSLRDTRDILNELKYLRFLGDLKDNDRFWVSSSEHSDVTSFAPFSPSDTSATKSRAKKLPILCTNSAPLTDKVNTDFSMSPKMSVTSNGTVFIGTRDHMTFRFMGIPFAQPPTGSLRFRYPERWTGTHVDATAFKPACLQLGFFGNNDLGLNPWGTSEDCLYLNVYTHFIPSDESSTSSLKPVLLWIHGGGNTGGTGSDATFDGGPLVSRSDVVVVTFNYRLNIFGFLGLNDSVITGNYAMADKIAALEWVRDNIQNFGGDPQRVTIVGQSAGGWSVVDLLRSPKAAGLFARAISQSGGSSNLMTQQAETDLTTPFLSQFCDSTGVERLECLQALPAETLLNITSSNLTWPTVLDGIYVVDSAVHQMSLGASAINSVPFLVGFMPEEGQSILSERIAPNATDFNETLMVAAGAPLTQAVLDSGLWTIDNDFTVYNATVDVFTDFFLTCPAENMITAAAASNAFPAMYVYVMQHAYGLIFYNPYGLCSFPVGHPQPYYRCHSGDLYEVFGTYHIFSQPIRIPEDISYTNLVQDMWAAFARTGDPNPDPAYLKARGPAYLSTLTLLEKTGWEWPQFKAGAQRVASLDYPSISIIDDMPDQVNGRCAVITNATSS